MSTHRPNGNHRSRAVMAKLAVAGLLISGTALAASPAGAVTGYRVVGTGGVGVWLRENPSLNAGKSYGPGEGAGLDIECQAWGDPVGSRNNHVWDRILWNGRRGWIPDTYTNTPAPANQYSNGIPRCPEPGSPPATPAPRPISKTKGDLTADWALRYPDGTWGGQGCIDAHLGSRGYVGGYSGGQCRQFVNCVVYAAIGRNPGASDYSFPGARQVSFAEARRGDLIQYGIGGHTAIVLENRGNRKYYVIDSNYRLNERVLRHDWTPPASAKVWRYE